MLDFSELISDLSLVDFSHMGGDFTWSYSHSWSRLDIFLVSSELESHYPYVCQKRKPRLYSDHYRILLDLQGGAGISNLKTCG